MSLAADEGSSFFLSTTPATRRDRTIALSIAGVSLLFFVAAVPFAGMPLAPIPPFVASYQSALAINDIITAILLFSQFSVLRSRALLFLASGYLFTAGAAIVHALTFPGLFSPTGLLGSGPQTTVWLFMIWHAGFPILILAYALQKDPSGGPRIEGSAAAAILASCLAIGIALAGLVWIATGGHDLLPVLLSKGRYTPIMIGVVSSVWTLSLLALVTLLLRRPHSVLDVWLMVALCAWLFEIALSAVLNVARFDLGFYAGRIYGLLAASFVLAVLLIDNLALQTQMVRLLKRLRAQAASDRHHYSNRERLFSAVVDSSNDAIITNSLGGHITGWNRAAERLFGWSAAEAVGQPIDLIVPSERRLEVRDLLSRIARDEPIEQFETVRIHKDGREVDVSLSISPIKSASGEIVGASKTARDVGEVKKTQRALNLEIEERRRIFETSQDLILVTNTYGAYVQVSPSVRTILGFAPEDMVGHTADEFIHPEDIEATREEMRAARRGERPNWNFEARYAHKDGHFVTLTWAGTWSEPVRRYFFIGRDLTEKRAAEAQLRQAQKIDAIGQLTGGVAHDFNNILTVILGTIEILSDAVADRPQLAAITKMIDEAAERGADLTRHLLAFARRQPLQPREIDVNALVLETIKLLRPTLGEHIEISALLSEDAWPALVDPSQLTTSVLNLALNARDAMAEGGKLVVETKNVELDQAYADANAEVRPGNYVLVAVSDTGSGISAQDIEKVFDPFFTTKEVGKGTGLGLSMVYGFIKQSEGHIKIYSEQGHGTTVKMYLPRSVGDAVATELPDMTQVKGGHELVLVVEDDELVRRYAVGQVKSLGYATLEAANATEALQVIAENPDIDLLFTDVIMPGPMNGRQLVEQALALRPSLKTLYTSGYTENAIVHHGRLDSGVLLLVKPYRKPDLASMIRLALAS